MQARYYDPVIGRFMSNDPVGFTGEVASFNRYSYVDNNPYKYNDPDGKHRRHIVKQMVKTIERANKRAKQLQENRQRGKEGEQKTRDSLGDDIAGEQVTLETKRGDRARVDFVKKDKGVVETKTGDAKLSKGQEKVKEAIDNGEPVIPRGKNAEKAGLPKNEPTIMKNCKVDRHC